jgi:type II secretory pathway pseudopilin PulG
MKRASGQAGVSQIVLLVVIVVALAAAYVAIDLYSGGEKDMLTVETRGVQIISALSAYRRESGAYPEGLDKLVPKYVPAVSKCPGGAPMGYLVSSDQYVLSCPNVVFKSMPYSYDSRSKRWRG